jgi:hypothetical protein
MEPAARAADTAVEPLAINKPLVAAWNFDEPRGTACRDASGNGCDALPERAEGIERIPGVFGSAIGLSGNHMLRISEKPKFGTMAKLSLSAWTMPSELPDYREIFRKEDGDHRVLFSFQANGTILSLGLNIGGYVECDAPIDPAEVIDGRWHHCAATFDGQWMRVYLDGKEIGSLERPGAIAAGGNAPGCIGSSSGGECFQGALDDLRIYADALSAGEVAHLYQNGLAALTQMTRCVEAGEPQVGRSPVVHWTFNEQSGAPVIREVSGNPERTIQAKGVVRRMRGVHGNALELRGQHALEIHTGLPAEVAKLTFSAWTKPKELTGLREIFRQECPNRLLLAYQDNGSTLALGVNAGGYEECDAKITPAQVLDGCWHHTAATFDGQWMRVYLDGKEIGHLERHGKLAASPELAGFIGSENGRANHFQGGLDDFRIYADAISSDQITQLYRAGLEAVDRHSQELKKLVDAVYTPGPTFATTLAACRKNVIEKGVQLTPELTEILLARLRAAFAEDYANFITWTRADLVEYLTAHENDFHLRETGRMIGLLLEYKPLTEHQWSKQTPEDRRKWDELEAIRQKFERLKAQGAAAQFSADWIAILFEAAPRIQFRPQVSEAVAPYREPETPEARTLTAAEARDALERDWLHQADQRPAPERIKDEIRWTRRLADRIATSHRGKVDLSKELAQLNDLEKQAALVTTADRTLYFKVREVKRAIAFKNPVIDFSQMLYVDMPFPQGSEWPHETRHRLGYMAVPGGRLTVLDGLSPEGKLRQLMPQAPLHGSFWRPDLSYDAQKVVFCFKPHNEKAFHLYEINLDGSGLRQLTDGIYDDFDPIYLPDDKHIIFSTTRGHTYVRCMPPTNAFSLARCDRDGKNLYLISVNNEPDYLPSVMNDGRVVHTRWEYTDKPLWRAQKLWTINPDGTQISTLWGNQSVWPDLLKDARSIPGSRRVMFTGSAHHNWFSGSVGIIDPQRGLNFPEGLTKVTADVTWPECGNGPVDPIESADYHTSGSYSAYYSPYPLSEQDFLVSANRGGKFVLYLMDVEGNRELIYEGANNIFHALPLRPRTRPPLIVDRVAWPSREERLNPKDGTIYSGNVYQNAPRELKNQAKYLRVLSIDHKTYTYWHKRPYISTGPVVSIVQSEGVKRILGTVPIEADGSVAFHAPAGIPLHFQLLDEKYRALQTMRSFVGLMPGERRGCLGCHESHSRTPIVEGKYLAMAKEARTITPPAWNDVTASYPRYVQPLLDKYCGKCHEGNGEAVKVVDFTPKPGFLEFAEPYFLLTGRPSWGRPYEKPVNPLPGFGIANVLMVEGYGTVDPAAYKTPKPMTYLSYKSPLVDLCSSGKHYGVKVDEVSLQRLIAWIDAMCPYRGDEEIRAIPDPEFQGVDWIAIRPRIQTAPRIVRPGPVD